MLCIHVFTYINLLFVTKYFANGNTCMLYLVFNFTDVLMLPFSISTLLFELHCMAPRRCKVLVSTS